MQPTTTRLLHSISQAVATLATQLDEQQQGVATNIQIALTELLLRADTDFFAERQQQACALVARGCELLPAANAVAGLPTTTLAETTAALTRLTAIHTRGPSTAAVSTYLDAVVDWENTLYQRRQQLPANTPGAATTVTAATLLTYLQKRLPARHIAEITNITTLTGGFSKTTILFDLMDADGSTESLVIRAEQAVSLLFLKGADVRNEFGVLQLAFAAGIPVAEPLWLETAPPAPLGRFIVSRRARGHNIGSRIDIQNPISDALLRDFMCKLASIHRLPISADNPHVQQSHLRETARCTTRQDAVGQLIAMWQDGINQLQLPPSPIIERALGWLATNIPADTRPPVLLHGDYGLHNILIEDDRVACILDWESSNLGHPLEDLAWLLDGLQARIERQRIIDLYEQASGERVCPATLCYFEVMNVLKFAVTCPTALALFAQHQTTPIDACQLGLFFTYFGTSRLNAAIARAEQLAHPATAL